jgi:hypothetical protein
VTVRPAVRLPVRGRGRGRPTEPVHVDFPGSVLSRPHVARVIRDGWFPAHPDGRGDVAVLEIAERLPVDVRPAAIGTWRDAAPRSVRVFGHPSHLDNGLLIMRVGVGAPRHGDPSDHATARRFNGHRLAVFCLELVVCLQTIARRRVSVTRCSVGVRLHGARKARRLDMLT